MISFLSICSGIEAASVALAPLGFSAIGFAEIVGGEMRRGIDRAAADYRKKR